MADGRATVLPAGKLTGSSLAGEAYELLRAAIHDGSLQPGQRLVDTELAEQLRVSRTPIREALRSLAAEGLVNAVHGSGFAVRRYSLRELEDTYELRALLEGRAARRAATLATPEELWQMEQAIAYSQRFASGTEDLDLGRRRAVTSVNMQFHDALAQASRSEVLTGLLRHLLVKPLVYRALSWYGPEDRARSDHMHAEILQALRDRNAQLAEDLTVQHTTEIINFLLGALSQHPDLLAEDNTNVK